VDGKYLKPGKKGRGRRLLLAVANEFAEGGAWAL